MDRALISAIAHRWHPVAPLSPSHLLHDLGTDDD